MGENKKNVVDVIINGIKISMISEENKEYLHEIADYINKKTDELDKNKKGGSSSQLMKLIVSVNIADELFRERKKIKDLEYELEKYIAELGKVQEENLMLKETISLLQTNLYSTKKTLQEYIEAFDDN